MDPSYLIYNKSVISNGWEERKFYPHLAAYTSMHCESIRDRSVYIFDLLQGINVILLIEASLEWMELIQWLGVSVSKKFLKFDKLNLLK